MATYSLSGSGVQALSAGVTAVHVTITTLPIAPSGGSANPTNYYHVGMLRFGDAVGYFDAIPIVGGPQWLAVPSGTTRCGYSLSGGSVISLVEVIGGTPPFGGAGALSSLSDVALTSPADTQLLTYQASSAKWINANAPSGGGGGAPAYLLYVDQKASGTAGGNFISGAWQRRDLNTELADTGNFGSVASNQLTLAAGTYRCRGSAPGYYVRHHKARLQDVTNAVTLIVGSAEFSDNTGSGDVTRSQFAGRFTLSGTTVLEVQHQCSTTANPGFGIANTFGVAEIYTIIEFEKE